jgi:hypothetical protein
VTPSVCDDDSDDGTSRSRAPELSLTESLRLIFIVSETTSVCVTTRRQRVVGDRDGVAVPKLMLGEAVSVCDDATPPVTLASTSVSCCVRSMSRWSGTPSNSAYDIP